MSVALQWIVVALLGLGALALLTFRLWGAARRPECSACDKCAAVGRMVEALKPDVNPRPGARRVPKA